MAIRNFHVSVVTKCSALPSHFYLYKKLRNTLISHKTVKSVYHSPLLRTSLARKKPVFTGPKYWNEIDPSLKLIPRLSPFKKHLKKLILESYTVCILFPMISIKFTVFFLSIKHYKFTTIQLELSDTWNPLFTYMPFVFSFSIFLSLSLPLFLTPSTFIFSFCTLVSFLLFDIFSFHFFFFTRQCVMLHISYVQIYPDVITYKSYLITEGLMFYKLCFF